MAFGYPKVKGVSKRGNSGSKYATVLKEEGLYGSKRMSGSDS